MKQLIIIIAMVFVTTSSYGRVFGPGTEEEVIFDFSGGGNSKDPSHLLDKSFSPYLRNVYIDNGRIETIKGLNVLGSTPTLFRVTGIFPFNKSDRSTTYFVTDSSNVLTTQDFNNYVKVSSGHDTNFVMRCIQVRGNMWCGNGTDSAFLSSGTFKTTLDGSKGTPNVPVGQFPIYYQERVWYYNISGDDSAACFSDLISTNNVIIEPDHFLAWPSLNCLQVGEGDGQQGSAAWIEDGLLHLGKEKSIYTVFGIDETNYTPRKTSDVGVASHDSVVLQDDEVYFVGHDGIYKGRTRISDLIPAESDPIRREISGVIKQDWDTHFEFIQGQLFGTTVTAAGFVVPQDTVTVFSNHIEGNLDDFVAANSSIAFSLGNETSTVKFAVAGTTKTFPDSAIFSINQITLRLSAIGFGVGACDTDLDISIINQGSPAKLHNSNKQVNTIAKLGDDSENIPFDTRLGGFPGGITVTGEAPFFSGYELNNSSIAMKVSFDDMTVGCTFYLLPSTATSGSNIRLLNHTTGQFMSEVSTTSTDITSWEKFNTVENLNTGNVEYFVRAATSSVNITTQVWVAIADGGSIGFGDNLNYVQWAATITSVKLDDPTNVDLVQIGHVEGDGNINRSIAASWDGRYHIYTSTTTSDTLSLGIIKSRITNSNPNAWTFVEGINIRAILNDNEENLYAGAASTGVFYTLDTGTNFDGVTINSIYDTPDMILGSMYADKEILNYIYDGQKDNNTTFVIESSLNGGDFSRSSFTNIGSGRFTKLINGVRGQGKTLRVRLKNEGLDSKLQVNSFGIFYKPTRKILER